MGLSKEQLQEITQEAEKEYPAFLKQADFATTVNNLQDYARDAYIKALTKERSLRIEQDERVKKLVDALKKISDHTFTLSYGKAIAEMKNISKEALTNYQKP